MVVSWCPGAIAGCLAKAGRSGFMTVRVLSVVAALLLIALVARAQEPSTTRYTIDLNLDGYPQKTSRECLESVVKAVDVRQVDYLVAQLADPQFVDMRVKTLAGGFKEQVNETRSRLAENPGAVNELRRFLKDGQFEEGDGAATVRLKDVKNRA